MCWHSRLKSQPKKTMSELLENSENPQKAVVQPHLVRRLLLWVARCHPKNQTAVNIDYPQLWYCWPRWTKRVKWVHRLKTWLCGKITGHEWSETESGYSGCGVDRWCRWCDKMVTMPLSESPLSGEMKDLSKQIKRP